MKKIALLLMTVLMATSIAACGTKDEVKPGTETPGTETGVETEAEKPAKPVVKKEITVSTKFVEVMVH